MPTTLSTHQHKLPLFFALGATTAIAALTFGYRFLTKTLTAKKKNQSSLGSSSSSAAAGNGGSSTTDRKGETTTTTTTTTTATTEEEEDAEAVRLMLPYFEQAVELSRTLKVNQSGMTPNDQLMLYGLYKQAKFGDCNVDAPSKLRIKEHAKHKAWTKFSGMAQPFAIMKYMEAVQHFATLASTTTTNNNTIGTDSQSTSSDTSLSPIPSTPPQTNYSYMEEDDDSDIVYEDDNGEVDTDDDDDDGDDITGADQSVGAFSLETRETDPQNFGMGGTQSTLMSYRHSSLDLGKMSFDSTGGTSIGEGGGGGIIEGVGDIVGANGLEPYDEEEEHPGEEDEMSILQAAIHNRPGRLKECIRQYQEEDERIQQQQQQQRVISSSSNNLHDDESAITRPTTNKPLVRRHNLNQADDTGQTPLHMASDKGHTECVSLLIQAGADVNAIDDAGISVLGAAVYGEDVEVVKMLLDAGADPDHEDEDGDTPRRVAEEGSCEEIKVLFQGFERKLGSGSAESEDGSYRQ